MQSREAFKIFIRHQLTTMVEDTEVVLTTKEIEYVASQMENDAEFYEELNDFLADFITDRY